MTKKDDMDYEVLDKEDLELIDEITAPYPFLVGDVVHLDGEFFATGGAIPPARNKRNYKVTDVSETGALHLAKPLNDWVFAEDCTLVTDED